MIELLVRDFAAENTLGKKRICVSKIQNVTVIFISNMDQCGSAYTMNDLHKVL